MTIKDNNPIKHAAKQAIPHHLISPSNNQSMNQHNNQPIQLNAAPPLFGESDPITRNTSDLNTSPHNELNNQLNIPINNQTNKHAIDQTVITVSFELAAHSPFLVIDDEKQEIHYDLDETSLRQPNRQIRPIPFASFSFDHPNEVTLSQLRNLINQSVNQSNNQTLARFTAGGLLTPHQSLSLQTSHFFFLSPNQSNNSQHVPIARTQEELFRLHQFNQSINLRVYQTITKPVLSTAHSRVRSLSNTKTPEQSISRSIKLFHEEEEVSPRTPIQISEGMISPSDRAINQPISAAAHSIECAPDGLSYSRLASINQLPPASSQRRRNSFDMNEQHTIDLLAINRHIKPSNQNTQSINQSINQSNPANIRRIASLDQSIYHPHGLRAPNTTHALRDSTLRQLSAPTFEGDPNSRSLSLHQIKSRTAAIDEEDGEISPLEFPQYTPRLKPSTVTFSPINQAITLTNKQSGHQSHRTQSLPQSGKSTPTKPVSIKRSDKQSSVDFAPKQFLSSSMPYNLAGVLKKDSPYSASRSPMNQPIESSPSSKIIRSTERHAYYNSMDEQPQPVKRRGIKSSEQLKHDLDQSIDQSAAQITNAKNDRKPMTPARSARKPRYERSRSVSVSAVELSEHSSNSNSEYDATATMPANMRDDFVSRLAAMRNEQTSHERSESPLHFSEMLNEFSKSSICLKSDQRSYQIVVIGERDLPVNQVASPLPQQSILESINQLNNHAIDTSHSANQQPRHRKNILSEFGALTTRVQPHPFHDPKQTANQTKIDTSDRISIFSDVGAFLASRKDEKCELDKKHARTVLHPSVNQSISLPPLWIAVEDAPASVIQAIGQHFGFHPLTIEDCQSRGIREKLEVFPEYLFIVFHALDIQASASSKSVDQTINDFASARPALPPRRASLAERILARSPFRSPATFTPSFDPSVADNEFNQTNPSTNVKLHNELDLANSTPVKVVIFPSCVLTFHRGGLKSVSKVRRQLADLYLNRLDNTAWVVHALLDTITDSLIPVVGRTCRVADALEDNIYQPPRGSADSKKALLRQMNLMGRRLAFLRQRMWSKRDILMSLIEKDWAGFLKGVKIPYLRDVYDHVETMLHRIDASIEVVDTIQSTYLSMVNIEVSVQAENVNAAMKKMSAAATIILPLTLVSAIMGMNILVPWQGIDHLADPSEYPPPADMLTPFIVLMALMVAFGVGMYAYFKQIRYI